MSPVQHPGGDGSVWYWEDHCVLRWPLVAAGLIAPAATIVAAVLAVVLGVVSRSQTPFWVLFGVMMVALAVWMSPSGQLLPYWWPIGIRLRQDGVAIGGVRWAERHPGRRRRGATVLKQGYQVFSSPWDGVTWIWVETDRQRLKNLRRNATYGRKPTPLGKLSVPHMTAALVIRVDLAAAALPEIHRARNPLAVNYSEPGYHQNRWVVPTRHPDRLREALASLPLPPGTVIDPGTAE
jgi:hypothetical protein